MIAAFIFDGASTRVPAHTANERAETRLAIPVKLLGCGPSLAKLHDAT